jgi:hypothetical protein
VTEGNFSSFIQVDDLKVKNTAKIVLKSDILIFKFIFKTLDPDPRYCCGSETLI